MRKVEVVPYDNKWCELFQKEAAMLKEIIPEKIKMHHIGSTSVPGLAAKPIIDMIMEVESILKVDEWDSVLERVGYEPRGENGISGRRYFVKQSQGTHTHHLHVFQSGDPRIKRHLAFRDYMMENCEEMEAYATLKEELAMKFTYDIESYIAGKDAFIKEVDRKTEEWLREQG
ncbi:GrpB family protein [Bacillus sp. 165]|uniref:GrpB family protein n=1 Tax=Bacillus sp. 165 TaxID=1529117 RepID=UPI001ADAA5BD|nr:GrpB family protein [Bacillus sp. 165]